MEDAAQVIEKLKARFRVESDSELAARLLISRSSVANWRNRDSVPDRYRRIADGEINWAAYSKPYGEMTDVERGAMRIAIARLVRDFGHIATDYRAFMEDSMLAASSWQKYWAVACKDLYREMEQRGSEDAHHTASLLVYNELFGDK
jgi:hypothetical protein